VLAVEFRFPGGRYHATPWDAHVNEGRVEWPPSPWRLLRALVATHRLKARDRIAEGDLRALVDALASCLPCYSLPSDVVGFHTRHYMPLYAGKTVRVFDTFFHLPEGARVVAAWPDVSLDLRLTEVFADLVAAFGYLGRAESWVEAALCESPPETFESRPLEQGRDGSAGAGASVDVVRVLAPVTPAEFARWRASAIEERTTRAREEKERRTSARGKATRPATLSPKEQASLESDLPGTVFDALLGETGTLRKRGWNRPPGSRWVDYARPLIRPPALGGAGRRPLRRNPTVARFALAGSVLPRLTEAALEAEKIRTVLLKHSDGAPVFSGRDPVSGALLSGHAHALVLPESNGRHGRVTHVTLFARMGFDERARAAIERLRVVWQRSGHDLQLALLGVGQPIDFGGVRVEAGQCPLLATSRVWVSRTPFVPTRHEKRSRRGEPRTDEHGLTVGSPTHDAIRLLLAQGFPRPAAVEPLTGTALGGKPTRWLAFRTERRRGDGRRGGGLAVGFRLRFDRPVTGPIAIGYGAHFGLGTFVPEA
jgi:CRISPR-associated protein Csb2